MAPRQLSHAVSRACAKGPGVQREETAGFGSRRVTRRPVSVPGARRAAGRLPGTAAHCGAARPQPGPARLPGRPCLPASRHAARRGAHPPEPLTHAPALSDGDSAAPPAPPPARPRGSAFASPAHVAGDASAPLRHPRGTSSPRDSAPPPPPPRAGRQRSPQAPGNVPAAPRRVHGRIPQSSWARPGRSPRHAAPRKVFPAPGPRRRGKSPLGGGSMGCVAASRASHSPKWAREFVYRGGDGPSPRRASRPAVCAAAPGARRALGGVF